MQISHIFPPIAVMSLTKNTKIAQFCTPKKPQKLSKKRIFDDFYPPKTGFFRVFGTFRYPPLFGFSKKSKIVKNRCFKKSPKNVDFWPKCPLVRKNTKFFNFFEHRNWHFLSPPKTGTREIARKCTFFSIFAHPHFDFWHQF